MEQRSLRRRWLVVGVVALIWMAAVLFRLSYLQLVCYAEYFAKAQHQQRRVFEISPKRGAIYDRKGRELAISIPMDSVFGDPTDIKDASLVAGTALARSEYSCRRNRNENSRSEDARSSGQKAFAGNRPTY